MRVLCVWGGEYIYLCNKTEHRGYKNEYIKYMKSNSKYR
jgi:hypothetical protein